MSQAHHDLGVNQRDLRQRHAITGNTTDPTQTKTVRDQYARQLRKRYRTIAGGIRKWVGREDWLGLRERGSRPAMQQGPPRPDLLPAPSMPVPRRPAYGFPSDEARIQAFQNWLQQSTDAVVLGGPGDRWTDDYVRYAYGRGVVHANTRLQQAGYQPSDVELRDTFTRPIHRDTLSVFYRRQYDLLQGVNTTMQNDMARVLTEGMLGGENPMDIARTMTQTVQGVGLTRANMIARTEVIHAYNEASLNRYESILGSTAQVSAVVEFLTVGDSRVCGECESLNGEIYTIRDAHNVIPVHPNCRCTWVPISRTQRDTM